MVFNGPRTAFGRGRAESLPAWRAGLALNQWTAISGTTGAGGAPVDEFGCFTLRPDTSELFIALAGGHGYSDNRVVGLRLTDNAPAWALRSPGGDPSSSVTFDGAYNPDGKPASRHTYKHIHWSAARNRIVALGARYIYGDGPPQSPTVDGFNPDTNLWDAAGTFSNAPAGWYGEVLDASGDGWSFLSPALGARKWTASTGAWSNPGVTVVAGWVRRPWCLDTLRSRLFGLAWADGEGANNAPVQVNAAIFDPTTNVMTAITFNASAALTQFAADTPQYGGMCYDPDNDRFLFYCGIGATAGRVYVITPNGTTTWDMSILSAGGASLPASSSSTRGLNGRIDYVPALKGVVVLPTSASGLYFLRTA